MLATDPKNFVAPWADQLPSGELVEYGPSASTHARLLEAHKLWTWRPERQVSREARSDTGAALRAYMRPGGLHLRGDVPTRELEVYLLVYEHGHSARWVARKLRLSRASVRVYLQRLRARGATR